MLKIILLVCGILIGCQAVQTNNSHKEQPVVAIIDSASSDEIIKNKENTMQEFLNSTIGTASVLVLVYIAGGVTFTPVWSWVKSKIPFLNK